MEFLSRRRAYLSTLLCVWPGPCLFPACGAPWQVMAAIALPRILTASYQKLPAGRGQEGLGLRPPIPPPRPPLTSLPPDLLGHVTGEGPGHELPVHV